MSPRPDHHFLLALYPVTRGLSFVLFEGSPEAPFDWGMKDIRDKQKNAKTLDAVRSLTGRYHPEAIVIEDTSHGSRRTPRIRRLYRQLSHLADTEAIPIFRYSRRDIRKCFEPLGAKTRYEIAKAIAAQIPALAHRLPPVRKIWMSEDPRQALFDAASLGITHYASHPKGEEP